MIAHTSQRSADRWYGGTASSGRHRRVTRRLEELSLRALLRVIALEQSCRDRRHGVGQTVDREYSCRLALPEA